MKEYRQIKIISDGTIAGTKVIDVESGQPIGAIQSVEWKANANDIFPIATIKLHAPIEVHMEEYEVEDTE